MSSQAAVAAACHVARWFNQSSQQRDRLHAKTFMVAWGGGGQC